jgi:hypothetical protein
MAKIEDLIAQIPDERLRKAIAGEVKALKKTKNSVSFSRSIFRKPYPHPVGAKNSER